MKILKKISLSLILLILGLTVALQYKATKDGVYVLTGDSTAMQELKSEINNLRERNLQLTESLNEKKDILNRLMETQENNNALDNELKRKYQEILVFAGLTDVKGKGAIIQIQGSENADISSSTLRDLINELKAGGAEAISVNGQRVVAMTDIRNVGSTDDKIMMNGVNISKNFQYEILVIGETEALKNVWNILSLARESLLEKGIETSIQYSDSVGIPALKQNSAAFRNALLQSTVDYNSLTE